MKKQKLTENRPLKPNPNATYYCDIKNKKKLKESVNPDDICDGMLGNISNINSLPFYPSGKNRGGRCDSDYYPPDASGKVLVCRIFLNYEDESGRKIHSQSQPPSNFLYQFPVYDVMDESLFDTLDRIQINVLDEVESFYGRKVCGIGVEFVGEFHLMADETDNSIGQCLVPVALNTPEELPFY